MKILVLFDGSDDGLEGVRTAATMLQATGERHEMTMALVGWPPRRSPIWERALSSHVVLDDLHRAMAEVAAAEFQRLRAILGPLGSLEAQYLEGDPVTEITTCIDRLKPQLVLVGLTRGIDAESVAATAFNVVRRSKVPILLAYGSVV
ncbi:MAG: universal stress protein [Vulcanimicrobiaceae bacterium]